MNDYSVSDYSIFDDAISNVNTFVDQANSVNDVISECKSELNDSIFMGPVSDNCQEVLGSLSADISSIVSDFGKISSYLSDTSSNYQAGDNSASNEVTNSGSSVGSTGSSLGSTSSNPSTGADSMADGTTMTSSMVTYSANSGAVDVSKYSNNSSSGFNVTTGNTTYSLSSSDVDLLYSIVSAESDQSYDDALAVATTILNRCEAPNWIASHGTDPIAQATAPNQFVVYQHGSYKTYINGNSPETVQQAVNDALNGVRNHEYLSFRSNSSTGYSNNMITSTGNRYK